MRSSDRPRDYERWATEGANGWSFAEVLPYCCKLERYAGGGDGPVGVPKVIDPHPIEAGVQAGYARVHDYNGAAQEGFFSYHLNLDRGYRSGTVRACIRPAMRHANVTVASGTQVTRVLLGNGCALGVSFLRDGNPAEARAEREVIVSAGIFGSPQLLMVSGIGLADELRSLDIEPRVDLPGVGCNLPDHLEVHLQYTGPKGLRLLRWHQQLHARVGAFIRSDDNVEHPDIQYHSWAFCHEGWSSPLATYGYCIHGG